MASRPHPPISKTPGRQARPIFLFAACWLLVWTAAGTEAPARDTDLPPRHRQWLEDVTLLISETEREVFLALKETYQRDHFIRRFWKTRDPFPQTSRNEFQEGWEARVEMARRVYEDLGSDAARMLMQLGEPSRRRPPTCTEVLRPTEVWIYDQGNEVIAGYFTLVFVGRGRQQRLWQPFDGLRDLLAMPIAMGLDDGEIARAIQRRCGSANDLLSHLAQSLDLSRHDGRLASIIPKPSDEWVRSFEARSTEVPEGAEPLEAELSIDFPGRHQSRTVVQGLVRVPLQAAEPKQLGDYRSYNFLIDGEVLRQGELFDFFRYRFDFPEGQAKASEALPLVVQRYLRPGDYRMILKVEDQGSKRIFRQELALAVPRVEARRVAVAPPGVPEPAAPGEAPAAPVEMQTKVLTDRLEEANSTIATGDHTVRIRPIPPVLSVGRLRVEAEARGEDITRVAFTLNGRPVMKKSRPPYSVELNLGEQPRVHTLRVAALDAEGRELAHDEILVNAGPHRFGLRLLEPQPGKRYQESVRVHAEVEVPEGERLDRVEIFLNETLLATLYQPPFEQPVLLPQGLDLAYIRVVARLRDGNATEDVVFINAPDYIDDLSVQFVELYTSVTNRKGDFIEGLTLDHFEVFEEGEAQEVRRFELVRDLPIHAGLVIDTSTSMEHQIRDVEKAAYHFLESVLTPKDRAAVITFADDPTLAVRFTNDPAILAGGLIDLTADGETALYDSIIFALHYFSGLGGKRTIIVLTDGEDSNSRYTFDDAVEFARRTGVSVYVIGLGLTSRQRDAQVKMDRLARETGGETYYIDHVHNLERVYGKIQQELRSQYLLAYQSSREGGRDGDFREVEVKVSQKGLDAKTIRGYFPQ